MIAQPVLGQNILENVNTVVHCIQISRKEYKPRKGTERNNDTVRSMLYTNAHTQKSACLS